MEVTYSVRNNETIAILHLKPDDFITEFGNIERKICNSDAFFFSLKNEMLWNYDTFYRGIAKCHPNDTFNLEKGKEIAYKRAYLKFLRDKAKKAEIVYKYLFDFFNREVDMYQHTLSSMNHIYDDLFKLTTD